MTDLDFDELRTVCVAMLDMLNRHEVTMMQFQHLAPAQDEMAKINAQRDTVRRWLAKLRDVETRVKGDAA